MITFEGRIVQFGFGAVGKSFFEKLPKEIHYKENNYYVVTRDSDEFKAYVNLGGIVQNFLVREVTRENFREVFEPLLSSGDLLIDFADTVGTKDIFDWCAERNIMYLNTGEADWPDHWYCIFEENEGKNALREKHQKQADTNRYPIVLQHGNNPGLVSHFVKAALEYMNIDRVDVAFNTHPHDDHIVGFQFVPETAEIGKLVITFPEDANFHMQETLKVMKDKGIPVEHAKNGDVLKLGEAEMEVIQCSTSWFSENNRSAMLMVKYGDCRILMAADVELDGQNELLKTRPDDLKADILKYPHHGVAIAGWNFLKHVGAELTVITNSRFSIKETRKDADRKKLPQVYTAAGMVRLRSDGEIWVVDQLPLEEE